MLFLAHASILAPPVTIGDEINTSIGLTLSSLVVSVGFSVAAGEQRASELGATAL